MAKKSSPARMNLMSIVSFVTLLLILVSVFVLSGSFSDLVTTITKSKASQANAKLTQSFGEAFKDGSINTEKWTVTKNGNPTVRETVADNLRIDVPEGSTSDKPNRATLTYKEHIKTLGDFRILAVMYRPIVTGEGAGASGVRFASTGANDDEGAFLSWQVNGSKSAVRLVVYAPDGTKLETQAKDLPGNVAILRLERVNRKYRAFFKPGNDLTADVGWIELGAESNAALGDDGTIALFTHNVGAGKKYPKVIGRFDQINIAWEGEAANKVGFNDAFANGNLDTKWKVNKSEGVQVYENANDNLILSLSSGATNNKGKRVYLNRAAPVIPQGKDFALNVRMFKPTVVGEGSGFAGLRFVSASAVDDEAASVRWVVGKDISRMVLVVRNPDGTLAEKASVNVPATLKSATLRLARVGNSYRGWYRTGDADTDFVLVGKEDNVNFGANGVMGLHVMNSNTPGKYPRMIARIDQANGSVDK